jgi:TonB family protein
MTTQSYQPQVNLTAVEPEAKEKWRLGGLVVLAVLLALALVFAYYRWFGDAQSTSETSATTSQTAAESRGVIHTSSRRTTSKHAADTESVPASDADLTLAPGITQSAVRSPLAVEVISSDGQHQIIGTRNDSIYLRSHEETPESSSINGMNAVNGTGAANPLLAKQQTLEGSVVLLATIDKDGNIQKLQPISGPEILFAAAREAVKQWRFKPYYASGAPVESETQITVKFAISAH